MSNANQFLKSCLAIENLLMSGYRNKRPNKAQTSLLIYRYQPEYWKFASCKSAQSDLHICYSHAAISSRGFSVEAKLYK